MTLKLSLLKNLKNLNYIISKSKKVLNETITNFRNQYADVNNLKIVTEKSSVYGDIEVNGENKKGLLNFELR